MGWIKIFSGTILCGQGLSRNYNFLLKVIYNEAMALKMIGIEGEVKKAAKKSHEIIFTFCF